MTPVKNAVLGWFLISGMVVYALLVSTLRVGQWAISPLSSTSNNGTPRAQK